MKNTIEELLGMPYWIIDILSEPDDTHMTIFHPNEKLLALIRALAASEGLFVWEPPIENG